MASGYEVKRIGQMMAVIHREAGDYRAQRTVLVIQREDALGANYWEEVEDTPLMRILANEIWDALATKEPGEQHTGSEV